MQKTFIIGVMGGGTASSDAVAAAYELGRLIARQGWILLNGGRRAGIMDASAKGAADQGGITVGILPDETDAQVSEHIQLPILTGMGSARNVINVLSSHVVVACPGGAGTISEIALALKYGKTVILLNFDTGDIFDSYRRSGRLLKVESPAAAVAKIKQILTQPR
jgi:uncharacterized protein (TIGR00725 family)